MKYWIHVKFSSPSCTTLHHFLKFGGEDLERFEWRRVPSRSVTLRYLRPDNELALFLFVAVYWMKDD